tara:strand:- start:1228 stop:1548 length:321 start_codon:yes stop_codon:yes gene_type:complete
MTYVFDIDGTICTLTQGKYDEAEPILQRIEKVNSLYDQGHTILFQTARGMGRSGNSYAYADTAFHNFTKEQLDSWGVKYHGLFLGKPAGDIYIDDKGCKDEDFFGG